MQSWKQIRFQFQDNAEANKAKKNKETLANNKTPFLLCSVQLRFSRVLEHP